MDYKDLEKVNKTIKTTDIKGKSYAEVAQRVKAFRMLFPDGTIETEMLSNENGVCVFKASIFIPEYDEVAKSQGISLCNHSRLIATGTAYEKENSTFINKTSYIENCETSAVGRALGLAGFGIDTSIASADEVGNAIANQEPTKEDAENYVLSFGKHKGEKLSEVIKNEWYKNYLSHGNDEYIKKCIELITGKKILTPEEEEQCFDRIQELNDLFEKTDVDREEFYKYYKVKSNAEMTLDQLNDAIKKLSKRVK